MMKNLCKHHQATLAAARSEAWESGLRDHVEGCKECLDLLRVHQALSILAQENSSSLRSPNHIWRQFQRQQKVARAVRPIRIVEYLAAGAAVAVGAFFLGPMLWRSLHQQRTFDLASQFLDAGPLLLAGTSALLAVLVSGIYAAWVES